MKLYYIDDSMFQNTPFAKSILQRFTRMIYRENAKAVLISSAHQNLIGIQKFLEEESKNRYILMSPAIFDFEGIKGNLNDIFLEIEGFERKSSYSGSCIEFDLKNHKVKRIYFDLFTKHSFDESYEISKELEDLIFDQIGKVKRQNRN